MLCRCWEGLRVCAVTGPQLWKNTSVHAVRDPPRHTRGAELAQRLGNPSPCVSGKGLRVRTRL